MNKEYKKNTSFKIFTFQIIPINLNVQLSFEDKYTDIKELIANKNNIFKDIIILNKYFDDFSEKIKIRVQKNTNDLIHLKLNVSRQIKLNTIDFNVENLTNFPNIDIFIDLNSKNQIISIENNTKAFKKIDTAKYILQKLWNQSLQEYNLELSIFPIYKDSEFWDLIDKYKEVLTEVNFEMRRPNLSRISETLLDDFDELNIAINPNQFF